MRFSKNFCFLFFSFSSWSSLWRRSSDQTNALGRAEIQSTRLQFIEVHICESTVLDNAIDTIISPSLSHQKMLLAVLNKVNQGKKGITVGGTSSLWCTFFSTAIHSNYCRLQLERISRKRTQLTLHLFQIPRDHEVIYELIVNNFQKMCSVLHVLPFPKPALVEETVLQEFHRLGDSYIFI